MLNKMLASLIEDTMNQFTVLTEHENGYCYELVNVALPLERAEVHNQLNEVLRRFNMQYFNIAKTHLEKDKSLYERMVKIQLASVNNEVEKEFYTRLFQTLHKAKSKPIKIIVSPVEALYIPEGLKYS